MNYIKLIESLEKQKRILSKEISLTEQPHQLTNLRNELDMVMSQIKHYNRLQFEENYERVGYGDE